MMKPINRLSQADYDELIDTLQTAVHALNTVRNTKIRHPAFKDTYQVAAEIDRVLRKH